MASNLSLGIIVGASTSGSVARTFGAIKADAVGLGKALNQVRLGRNASDDVIKYQNKLETLKNTQAQFGTGNTRLWSQIADTERELRKASGAAEKYGLNIGDITRENARLLQSEQRIAGQLQRSNTLRANKDRRSELGGQVLGTIGAVYAIAKPLKDAMSFEHEMRLFGNVVGFTNEQLNQTKVSLNDVATATNQRPGELLSALNTLASKGLDPGRSIASLNIIGKTATAAGADVNELSETAFTLIDTMGLSPDQLPKAMDMLSQAGKMGSFELKSMAQYFPMLTAQAKTLGVVGVQGVASLGAALQIAMKGASDPAAAANNFQNFLAKLTSKETVKNFADMGVNVQQEMKKATDAGLDPVVEMIKKIQEITGGSKFKLSELFGDMQVTNFLNPMLANMKEFERIKSESLKADGVVAQDFNNMMVTSEEQLKQAAIAAEQLSNKLATALFPSLIMVAKPISDIIGFVGKLASDFPLVTKVVVGFTVGLVALKVATLAYGFSVTLVSDAWVLATGTMAFFTSGAIATNTALAMQRIQLVGASIAQGAMAVKTGAITAAQWLWNAALSANPIGLVVIGITAFGALAYTVYKNWEPIMKWFRESFAWLGNAVSGVAGFAGKIGSALGGAAGGGSQGATAGNPVHSLGELAKTGANAKLPSVQSAKGAGAPITTTNNPVFHITQQPGEDQNSLADRIMKKMQTTKAKDKRGALHD